MDSRVTRVQEILELRRLPIKIGFLEVPPASLPRWSGGPVAAGCVFWDRAMEGKSFYTLPLDHWNCAIGSHTHKIALPEERAAELGATIGFMVETRYLDMAEVPGIPTLDKAPGAVAYAPASSDAFKADVVLMAATPVQLTLIYEAALKAGISKGAAEATSRPSCAILPASVKSEIIALSFGCRGNRAYTKLGDDEMYVSVPGSKWDEFVDRLIEVQRSNLTMGNYYQAQNAKFASPK
jgi:uncharacterized protein (DUF169 family)